MRFGLSLGLLLLATCLGFYSTVALADRTALAANSIHRSFRGDSVNTNVFGRKLATEASNVAVDADGEERAFERIKSLVQRATQSVKRFQRNPAAIKEVENLKNSPVVVQSIQSVKQNPAMVQRINSLKQHPEILKSLQNAPTGQSVNKLQKFITGGKSNPDGPSFFVCFMLIMGGFTATLLLVNILTQV